MLNRDFTRKFLYGAAKIDVTDHSAQTTLPMLDPMEGWIGIPHGGISMSILIDLAMSLNAMPHEERDLYPFAAEFRLGGASVKIGDTLQYNVSVQDGHTTGAVVADHSPHPYLSSSIRFKTNGDSPKDPAGKSFPSRIEEVLEDLSPLPNYRNCFVCGLERSHPGLRRHFLLREKPQRAVIAAAGFDLSDQDNFYRFQRQMLLHPLPTVALLDEIIGWGGFFLTGCGAVTVKIDFEFKRPVHAAEKLIFVGRGDRLRGNPKGRLLFWASGGAAVVHPDGSLEWIATASGQYFGVQDLTEQMKRSLLPADLTEKIFAIAGDAAEKQR